MYGRSLPCVSSLALASLSGKMMTTFSKLEKVNACNLIFLQFRSGFMFELGRKFVLSLLGMH